MTRIDQAKALARAKDLVQLAAHKDTPKNEAAQAAITACKYIRKYKLLEANSEHPLKTVVDTINDPNVRSAASAVAGAVGMVTEAVRARRRGR